MRFLVLEASPRFGGGCEAFSLELTKALSERGHEILLAYENDDSMLPVYRRYAVEVWQTRLPLFRWRKPRDSIACVRRIGRYCRAHQIQAIASSHLGYLRTLALVKVFYRIATVYHLGLSMPECSNSLRWAMKQISAGAAPSEHTANAWRQCGWPEKRLHVVPNWVDAERFVPCDDRILERRELHLDAAAPIVAYVGRITPPKGIETLLRAFAGVVKVVKGAKLVLVGDAEAEYLEKIDELRRHLGLAPDDVLCPGPTNRPEQYQAVADVVVLPSQVDESFGLVLIESMACGTLTLASSVGILPQILGEQNVDIVFPPGDVQALEAKLIWWLKHPEDARQRGSHLRERAMATYGPTLSVDAYERLLIEAGSGSNYGSD